MASITMKDVAEAAGVSKSTVQRALANDPRTNEETKKRILKLANDMGYKPDPVFSSMASRVSRKKLDDIPLAFLNWKEDTGNMYFSHARERAKALGYILHSINLKDWEKPEQIWRVLYARGFAGVLLGKFRENVLPLLRQNELFPMVCVGRFAPLPFHTVRPGIVKAVHQMWQHLLKLGYTRIGAAIGQHEPTIEDDFSRLASVLGCQQEFKTGSVVPPFGGHLNDVKGFMTWVKQHEPDVVIGFHVGHFYALQEAGYSIPKDIGYFSLHGTRLEQELHITSLTQNMKLIAEVAINLLDQMIHHSERGVPEYPLDLLVESLWTEGETLRKSM